MAKGPASGGRERPDGRGGRRWLRGFVSGTVGSRGARRLGRIAAARLQRGAVVGGRAGRIAHQGRARSVQGQARIAGRTQGSRPGQEDLRPHRGGSRGRARRTPAARTRGAAAAGEGPGGEDGPSSRGGDAGRSGAECAGRDGSERPHRRRPHPPRRRPRRRSNANIGSSSRRCAPGLPPARPGIGFAARTASSSGSASWR